jgi:hypothetical protein
MIRLIERGDCIGLGILDLSEQAVEGNLRILGS